MFDFHEFLRSKMISNSKKKKKTKLKKETHTHTHQMQENYIDVGFANIYSTNYGQFANVLLVHINTYNTQTHNRSYSQRKKHNKFN